MTTNSPADKLLKKELIETILNIVIPNEFNEFEMVNLNKKLWKNKFYVWEIISLFPK